MGTVTKADFLSVIKSHPNLCAVGLSTPSIGQARAES